MSKHRTLPSPFMTYVSSLEARQSEQCARKIAHTQTQPHTNIHKAYNLLLWNSSHERPKNLLPGLLGTIRAGISYMCLCVRASVFLRVTARVRLRLHETVT